ncbi:hypothetical protein PGTUg99_003152 [Puccinia graminis f. sp. tritici]|uniref:Oligopeptide transporter n=1 Tax=Puccinia graminis f. sp. tritici TaxID=56615 RepID=A0A5B0NAB2_PUCGR|nr:hypothetical protein PGTUg99_003152 [Puccinia graminis f. sp. tritici]
MDSPVGLDHRSQDTGALNPHQKSLIVDSVVDLKQIPVPILPQSVTDTRTEIIEEENARISATSDGLSPSDTHLALSPTPLVKQGREADEKIDPPASEQKVEIVPLKDDPESLIMTVRSVLIGVLLSAFGVSITQMISAYELYFDRVINFGVAFGISMSAQLLGFGWAGLLQPIIIYPSRTVFPEVLPSVSLLNSLFKVGSESEDQVKFFKKAFIAIGILTAIFGGARPLEGMGILSISADWSLVGGRGPLYMPRSTQVYELLALVVSTLVFFLVYSKSWFDAGLSQNFPFMSTSLLTADGKPYPYRQAIKEDGTANEEFIQRTGLPFFTATFYIVQVLVSVFLTSSITHAVLHNYHIVGSFFKKSKTLEGIDPHRLACMKYKDFPIWGFVSISVVAVALALGMTSLDKSGISFVGLLVALVLSFLMTLAAGFINAMAGFRIRFSGGIQMLGGLLFPGNVFGSMWFTLYGASSAIQGISILRDSKYGQYIHLPQNLVVYSQLMGCTVGSLASLVVVKSILKNEREVLLSPSGDGVFSGAEIAASRRALSGQCHQVKSLYASAYAGEPMRIIIGLMSQFWARKYRPRWFTKYNYILSAALDGGTELVVFFLAMIFQGGGGKKINFPTYFLNPAPSTPRDYCFMNREARGSGSES